MVNQEQVTLGGVEVNSNISSSQKSGQAQLQNSVCQCLSNLDDVLGPEGQSKVASKNFFPEDIMKLAKITNHRFTSTFLKAMDNLKVM